MLNSAPNRNPGQGDLESPVRDLTISRREAKRPKDIADEKSATASALARDLQSVNQFWESHVRKLSQMHAQAPVAEYSGGYDPNRLYHSGQYNPSYGSPGQSVIGTPSPGWYPATLD